MVDLTIKALDYNSEVDGAILTKLLNEYALDPMGGGHPLDPEILQNLPSQLASRVPNAFSFVVLVCKDDGEEKETTPAGLVICFEGFSTFAGKPLVNVHDLYVCKDFRGMGIASRLLHAVEGEARKRGCCKVTLECLSGNQIALAAYKKSGFDNYELDPQNGHALFLEKKLT